MKLGTYRTGHGPALVVETSRGWLDVGAALGVDAPWTHDVGALLVAGDEAMARVRAAAQAGTGPVFAPDESRLGPPIAHPGKILCVGLNYREHAREGGHEPPAAPEYFVRVDTTLAGPADPVPMPTGSDRFDLEAELAFVVGRAGRFIAKADAMAHVAGYMVFNDMSVRDLQKRGSQWTPGKNWDGSGPCGPFFVTADEIPDPGALDIGSTIDDFVMQASNTSDLIFDLPTIIADLSRFTTLEPGDLVATGTPPGVGDARKPPRYLKVGETARCTVAGLGTLANRVVDEREWLAWRSGRAD